MKEVIFNIFKKKWTVLCMVWCAAFDRATPSTIIARRTNRARCHVRDCSNSGSGDQQYGGESRHHGPSVMMILKNQLDTAYFFMLILITS